MAESVLVFISHSSSDKKKLIEPIVNDLEDCYINVWLDKRKIAPGDNLRKSIFRDGLDKADIALIFFTEKSLQSSWVDKEIKHVLREDFKKGNDFNLNKIISIFDSTETYQQIQERYPELTDDLLHLMPKSYDKIQLGQLVSAIWSKYFSLKGEDMEGQKKLLAKEREIFKLEKEKYQLTTQIEKLKSTNKKSTQNEEFEKYFSSGITKPMLDQMKNLLDTDYINKEHSSENYENIIAIGLLKLMPHAKHLLQLTPEGREYLKWVVLNNHIKE